MSKPISESLSPDMVTSLRLGSSDHGSTVHGLVRRHLACPGSGKERLRLTPMGKQWGKMLVALSDAYICLGGLRAGLSRDDSRDMSARLCMLKIRRVLWP